MGQRTGRLLRAVAALTLAAGAMPLGAGPSSASQHGDDHKVTLCHRTNSETNPYVVITVDVASVFKNNGHDSHDEGGVYQPGDKARGVRWGDIIPPFSYFASPQDEKSGTVSQYPGLNYGADGQAILANGCQVPGPPPPVDEPHPGGSLQGECPEGGGDFVVSGSTNDDDGDNVQFRLNVGGASFIAVPSDGAFEQAIDAASGTVVTLEFRIGSGAWTSTGETVKITDCPPTTPPVAPTGQFVVQCTAAGWYVDILTLDRGTQTGGRFELVVNGTAQRVTSNQKGIPVPADAALVLRYVAPGGATTTLDSETVTGTCPPPSSPPPSSPPPSSPPPSSPPPSTPPPSTPPPSSPPPSTPPPSTPPATPQPDRGLDVEKSVSPSGPSTVGATLTYTLVVTTTGNAAQTNVTVSDYLPGYAPGTDSGTTTYVAGSATCSGSGTCTTAYSSSTHQVTWGLGTMPAGTSRSVSFKVIIDEPTVEADGSIEAVDIVNIGVVGSDQVPTTPSNEVVTPVPTVQGTKTGQPPVTEDTGGGLLPHTGSTSLAWTLGIAGLLLLVGGGLVSLPVLRRRS